MRLTKANLWGMSRAEFIGFGRGVDVDFSRAASLRLLTFGRILNDYSSDNGIRCGGHPVEARCVTLDGRFPPSLTAVLRGTYVFAELAAAAKRLASPSGPP
jgi:hypothetical protein